MGMNAVSDGALPSRLAPATGQVFRQTPRFKRSKKIWPEEAMERASDARPARSAVALALGSPPQSACRVHWPGGIACLATTLSNGGLGRNQKF
jgi:hypothetical protein